MLNQLTAIDRFVAGCSRRQHQYVRSQEGIQPGSHLVSAALLGQRIELAEAMAGENFGSQRTCNCALVPQIPSLAYSLQRGER
jgi:hypothetical protein